MSRFNIHVTKNGYGWLFKGISAPTKSMAMRNAVDRWDFKMQNKHRVFFIKNMKKPYRITVFTPSKAVHSMLMRRTSEKRLKEVM